MQAYDETDLAPHEYRDCSFRGCTRTARDADLCTRHTPRGRILDRCESLRSQLDLAMSLCLRDQSYREDVAHIGRHLGVWVRALAMSERRVPRTARRFCRLCSATPTVDETCDGRVCRRCSDRLTAEREADEAERTRDERLAS